MSGSSSVAPPQSGSALLDVPSAALEGALPAAAALGASAAAPVVGIGGTAAALAAGAGVGAASGGDAIARARAVANGNAAPSAGDLAIGLGAGAGAGALSAVGDGLSGVLGTSGARGILARFLGSFSGRQAQRVAAAGRHGRRVPCGSARPRQRLHAGSESHCTG